MVIDDDVVDTEWRWMNADTVPHLTDFAILVYVMGVATLEAKTHVSIELSNLESFFRRHTYAKKQRWLGNSGAVWVASRLVRKEKLI